MTPADNIRIAALLEAVHLLRQRADVLGVEHGDYAAKIVVDDARLIADLADEYPVTIEDTGLTEAQVRADERLRLIHHLELRTFQSVQRVIEDLHHNGWNPR